MIRRNMVTIITVAVIKIIDSNSYYLVENLQQFYYDFVTLVFLLFSLF